MIESGEHRPPPTEDCEKLWKSRKLWKWPLKHSATTIKTKCIFSTISWKDIQALRN